MHTLVVVVALMLAVAAAETTLPYPLPDGSTLVSYYEHPYYGGTWLVHWRGSQVLAIPNIYHRWALSFYAADVLLGQ